MTLVEYLDYQCSHCQAAHPVIERVLELFPGQVRFVVRHFPVVSAHPQAEKAALAAEAAGRQGRFWEMHRRLMEARGALEDEDLVRYARGLNLDLARFRRDLADEALGAEVRNERLMGARSGVNGTPTLYLGGLRYGGDVTEEELKAAIEAALEQGKR